VKQAYPKFFHLGSSELLAAYKKKLFAILASLKKLRFRRMQFNFHSTSTFLANPGDRGYS
jgi:hypothetical protein